ncbi:MAG TPA: transporter [Cyclobacteriaceae bacterium]|nr:transporter [Cyclobacteriaceae bacterium]
MNRILLLIVILLLCVVAFFASAQTEKPEIVTDRPDQTEAPVLVPKGGLQVELGTSVENDKSQDVKFTNYTYGTALIKYGVNENFELRLISEYLGERIRSSESQPTNFNGLSPLALGVKIKLADEKGFWPQAALIGHINLKSGSSEFAPEYTAADFRFTFAHTLSDRFSLSYNIGTEWNGQTPDATFIYTVSVGYVITSKLGMFVESYGFLPEEDKADHRLDAGFTYKFSPVVQFDVSGGIGITETAPDSFISTGISFRLFK